MDENCCPLELIPGVPLPMSTTLSLATKNIQHFIAFDERLIHFNELFFPDGFVGLIMPVFGKQEKVIRSTSILEKRIGVQLKTWLKQSIKMQR